MNLGRPDYINIRIYGFVPPDSGSVAQELENVQDLAKSEGLGQVESGRS